MFSFAKFLRISLPVATGACAIVATTLLVASIHDKDKLKKNENDEILKDLEKSTEEFKEEKIINEEQQEKEEVDNSKEKGAQGTSDKKQELTEEQEKATRKELVQKVMEGKEVVLGENTLRGNGSSEDQKVVGVESPTPNIPALESSPPEGDSLAPKAEDEMSSGAPDEPKGQSEKSSQDNDDGLEKTQAVPKEEKLQDQVEATEEHIDKGPNSDDAVMQDAEDDMEEESGSLEGEDLEKAENQSPRDDEVAEETEEEIGLPSKEGEPDGGTRKESAAGEQEEPQTDSTAGDNDGIEGGTAEEDLPNLDLLNSLESKLNKEIGSLGFKLRNLGINF